MVALELGQFRLGQGSLIYPPGEATLSIVGCLVALFRADVFRIGRAGVGNGIGLREASDTEMGEPCASKFNGFVEPGTGRVLVQWAE